MRRIVALAAVVLLAGCFGVTTESRAPLDVATPGTWTTLAPLPTPRQEVAAAALDGRVFVIGGFGENAEPVAVVEAYDPTTDRWEARAPLPAPTHHAAAAVVSGRLFVVGGFTGGRMSWVAQAELYEYDPARNAWIARAPLPTPRGALAAAAVGDRLHAVGGSSGGLTPAHEIYDPATNRWTAAAPLAVPRDHLAAASANGHLWAIGGRRSFLGEQYDNVDVYVPADERWTVSTPLPSARGGLAAAVLGNRVFVFGGEAPLRIFASAEMYDPVKQQWIAKTAMPTPRHGIAAVALNGRIYVAGGGTQPGFARSDVNEAYQP
ncbi:MAG TPA: kelch repeat-containing protein [Methylomirabilota bacterium]